MAANLDNRAFQDDELAREWFEERIWPNGPVCSHCGSFGQGVTKLTGKAHRPGLYQCNACRGQFTVTTGTVMERSKIGLHIWLKAMFLLSSSKKGISTHQLHRMLGVSLKSTWFLMHRIREAAREPYLGALMGGRLEPVQADETFIGRRTTRAGEVRQRGYMEKEPVLTLVDGKQARSFHLPAVNAATLKPILREQISKAAMVYRRGNLLRRVEGRLPGWAFHRPAQCRRIRPRRRDRERVRELLFDLEARHLRRLPARQPDAPKAVHRRVRFPVQQPCRAWRERYAAHREAGARRGRQAADISKSSSATRSRSVLAGRFGAGATLRLRPSPASWLSSSMRRRSLDDLIDDSLKSLPCVGMQFDALFIGRRRSWLISRQTRHRPQDVVE